MSLLGENIKRLREERDLSQEQLANLVNVSQSKISHCETGARGISFMLAVEIARALGISVNELVPLAEQSSVEMAEVA